MWQRCVARSLDYGQRTPCRKKEGGRSKKAEQERFFSLALALHPSSSRWGCLHSLEKKAMLATAMPQSARSMFITHAHTGHAHTGHGCVGDSQHTCQAARPSFSSSHEAAAAHPLRCCALLPAAVTKSLFDSESLQPRQVSSSDGCTRQAPC